MRKQLLALQKFDGLDEFTRTVILDKVAKIVEGSNNAEIRQFLDYLDIYEAYSSKNKESK